MYRAFDKSQLTFVVVLSTKNQATRRFAREIKKSQFEKIRKLSLSIKSNKIFN